MLNQAAMDLDGVCEQQQSQYAAALALRLRIELTSDPNKIGYAGKTADAIAELLNSPVATVTTKSTVTTIPGTTFRQALDAELSKYTLSGFYVISDAGVVTCGDSAMAVFLVGVVKTAKANVASGTVQPGTESQTSYAPPPWLGLIEGIPYAENAVSAADVAGVL